MKAIGYKATDRISHRRYNFKTSVNRFKRTGQFAYRKDGSGHRAGEEWGRKKGIDPNSRTTKYSKNSPSFDEGVYTYKARNRALTNKLEE